MNRYDEKGSLESVRQRIAATALVRFCRPRFAQVRCSSADARIVLQAVGRVSWLLRGRKRFDTMLASTDSPLRILTIDDNHDVADSTAELVRCFGAQVLAVYDGVSALSAVTEFKPHLALIDLGMPGMDGFQTARGIRNLPEGRSLVLAAHTAWRHEEARQRAKDAGFDYHLVKPVQAEDLIRLLAAVREAR